MSRAALVLVVEDDDALREALCDTIEYGGYRTVGASNGARALEVLERQAVDLVISDVQMDVMDGHALLRRVKAQWPNLPFVLVTAYGSVEKAVEAIREGATDYLLKPFEAEVLLETVSRLASVTDSDADCMIAEDPAMVSVRELLRRVAGSGATVMISGESGCGKEVVARFVHRQSDRAEQPFVAINCAAIPESMLESMLFGYEKGAYTGAHQTRAGKFEHANGGTLLLDEISEMDLGLQAKLLRVLQEKEVERLGGSTLIPLDVRVLATTNRDLREEVARGRFREDLYYRLNVFPVHVPPLRERRQDILPLATHLLQRHAEDRCLQLAREAELKLLAHDWHGNVRELENCMQRAAILTQGNLVTEQNIFFEDAMRVEPQAPPQVAAEEHGGDSLLNGGLKDRERQLIVNALQSVGGRRKDAAEILGISPRTLRYKLAKLKEQGVSVPAAG
ncbi:MAG: sigma-54-dependent Fis family transcriptional regulator [Halioglobus sp.]|nr:sigma-54-dependent Fis family transcriptional regulator [Halioglobus sp.]|tara:strand:+ start:301 stop:1653 length:1353 start_codon:yes stop_codon:yes gene_type:complete